MSLLKGKHTWNHTFFWQNWLEHLCCLLHRTLYIQSPSCRTTWLLLVACKKDRRCQDISTEVRPFGWGDTQKLPVGLKNSSVAWGTITKWLNVLVLGPQLPLIIHNPLLHYQVSITPGFQKKARSGCPSASCYNEQALKKTNKNRIS